MTIWEPGLSLLGVMDQREAQAHLETIAGPNAYTPEETSMLWQASRQAYQRIEDAGFPETQQMPSSLWQHILRLHEHESSSAMTGGFAWSVRLVEIDPVLSLAIDIQVSKLERWESCFRGASFDAIVNACLPLKSAPVSIPLSPYQAFLVHDDLGATWQLSAAGGISLGFVRPPLWIRAGEVSGRLFLIDGYHRAIALRRLGHTHIPCVIVHDCTWTFLRGTPRFRRFEPPPFARPDPPCVGHFLTPAAVSVKAIPLVRVMTVRVESFIAPITRVPYEVPTERQ